MLQTVTDERGQFRFEYAPARSEMQVVVTASGMLQQRQYLFNGPKSGLTDREKLEQPFLEGVVDSPAVVNMAPAPRSPEQGRGVTSEKNDVIRSD